jgi:cholesterol transport system auxiliary component
MDRQCSGDGAAALIQSFQNTGRLPVVASSRQTLMTNFLLVSNVRKFQVEKDAAGVPQATVVLETTLLRLPRREPVATARFEKTTPVLAASIDAVTAAFNASLAHVIRRVVDWTLEHGSAVATAALPRGDVALVRATKIHGMSSTSA